MDITGSFLDVLAPRRDLWGKGKQQMGTYKRLLSDSDDETYDSTHEEDNRQDCVAVLTISPPNRLYGALCRLDSDWLTANRKRQTPTKLQDAPVSLCATARLNARLQAMCREHPATGPSSRYRVTYWLLLVIVCLILVALDIVLDLTHSQYRIVVWIIFFLSIDFVADRVHRTSPKYTNALKRFNDAMLGSELESSLASLLGGCGYRHVLKEDPDGCWKVILYQIEETEPKLPSVSKPLLEEEAFENELEEAKKLYQFYQRFGTIKTHHKDPPNQDDEDPLGPLDFWTFRGLALGQALSLSENHATSQKVGLTLCFLYLVGLFTSLSRPNDEIGFAYIFIEIAGIFFGLMAIVTVSTAVNHIFDRPGRDAANVKLAKALSPLIRDRHCGYDLSYCPSTPKFLCFRKSGTFVLDPPTLLEMPSVV